MIIQFNPDLVIVSAGYDAALGCFEVYSGAEKCLGQCLAFKVFNK